MSTITIIDETTTGEKHAWSLDFLDETVSLRELSRSRIYQEVTEYNAREVGRFHGLVQPVDAERTLNGLRLKSGHKLNWENHYEKAIDAFTRRRYLVMVNDRQITDLDALVELRAGSEVTEWIPMIQARIYV